MTARVLLLLLLAGGTTAAPLAAQRRAAAPVHFARVETGAPAELSAAAFGERRSRAATTRRSVLTMLGGAVIGAGAGYLTSQVAWSDWDKSSNSEFKSRRLNFTLGGGAVGALTGLLVGHQMGSGAAQPGTPGAVRTPEPRRGTLLSEEEVRGSTATTVYELLQALRPQWLRVRGDNAHGDVNVETVGIRVYVERGFVGGIDALRQISTAEVTSVEFLDAATATYRLGQGNPLGAIVVHTGRIRQ